MKAELRKSNSSLRGIRGGIILVCAVVLLAVLFVVGERRPDAGPTPTMPAREAPGLASTETGPPALDSTPPPAGAPVAPAPASIPSLQPTAYARQLVRAISRQDHAGVPLTPEEAEEWKANLDRLTERGADGAAAIAEFLQTNLDVRLGRAGLQWLGVDSVREALFEALVRIGGPEAVSATLQALRTSAEPREIALLAQSLDTLAPQTHRGEALAAARDVLAMAAGGKLPGYDVAPLFEVIQSYGGVDEVPDLKHAAGTWQYYAAIALAGLPDGVGIPALAEMAEANASGTTIALQLLAQLSGKHDQARTALLEQADRIPASAWPFLAAALAGNEYRFQNSAFHDSQRGGQRGNVSAAHVRAGNQTFYNAFIPASLTEEEIQGRIAFVDELRAATAQPTALEALRKAGQLLTARLPNIAASH